MRIDAHQHFWAYVAEQYGWIGERQILKRDYLPTDLAPLLSEIGFDGSIAVQARTTLEETEWLLELADQYPLIKGVVGWVDLSSDTVGKDLARFSANPRFVGIRHGIQGLVDIPNELDPVLLHGLEILGEFDLAFDLLVRPQHLTLACDTVRRFPKQRFVLDHIAKPPIKSGRLSPWDVGIRELAAYPNVFCKLSGMVTEADSENWRLQYLVPYLDVVMDAFGSERTMIGSDWPVCTDAGEYPQVMGATMRYIERFTSTEQDAICGGNAQRAYQIQEEQ